jgi:predicted Zn-dependent peptidase
MGKMHDPILPILFKYLPYLGTKDMQPSEIQQAFFRLGISFDVSMEEERCYISLSGLEKSMEEALILLEKIINGAVPNADKLKNVASDIIIKRENALRDRAYMLRNALGSYARYGANSPFNFRLNKEQLLQLDPENIVQRIHELNQYEHAVYYFGSNDFDKVIPILRKHHIVPSERKAAPHSKLFLQVPNTENQVLFYNFPIVQTDLMWISKGTPDFNLEEHFMKEWYNEYFGYGLSSIVFQEIRESKALAYSAYAYFRNPAFKEGFETSGDFIGTQADKLDSAIVAMNRLLGKMPLSDNLFSTSKSALLSTIESERLLPSKYVSSYLAYKRQGIDYDFRSSVYKSLQKLNIKDIEGFHSQKTANTNYALTIGGSEKRINKRALAKYGVVEELKINKLLGFR